MAQDSFQGARPIILQPGTLAMAYTFEFEICSAADANDGSIPFGRTIDSVAVKVYDVDRNDVTTDIINGSPSESAEIVTIAFDYPTTNGAGVYNLEILCTLDDASVEEFDFNRIIAKDMRVL